MRSGHTNILYYFGSSEFVADDTGLERRDDVELGWIWRLEIAGVG